MVKLKHKGLLVIGINKKEMELMREGAPIPVSLVDLDPKLKGQMIMIIPGSDDQYLLRVMNTVADAYENGATSPIEIAKSIPRQRLQ
jgi:hypothetical protein